MATAATPGKARQLTPAIDPAIDKGQGARCHSAMPSLALPGRWLRRSAAGLLDLLLPPRCLGCGATIGRDGELWPRCWGAIAFLGAPHCACW
jgi:hypothetical protein